MIEKTKLKDAVRTGVGKLKGKELVICCMHFAFIGGSMGAVVGERIERQDQLVYRFNSKQYH